ncbi:MAG TPA: hypothetical protein PKL83_03660 [bacterium]|nr:hypothetical protein [bacterium]
MLVLQLAFPVSNSVAAEVAFRLEIAAPPLLVSYESHEPVSNPEESCTVPGKIIIQDARSTSREWDLAVSMLDGSVFAQYDLDSTVTSLQADDPQALAVDSAIQLVGSGSEVIVHAAGDVPMNRYVYEPCIKVDTEEMALLISVI